MIMLYEGMNMNVFNKKKYYGYYKKNVKEMFYVILTLLIGIVVFFLLKSFLDIRNSKDIFFSVFYLIASVYYWFVDKRIQNESKGIIHCGEHSARCIKAFHKYILVTMGFSVCSLMLSFMTNVDDFLYLLLLIFIMLIGFGMMQYSLIIFFKEEYYYSSGFKIYYTEIDNIIREEEIPTADGILCFCRLEKDKKIIGYEKILISDYIFLENKISR